MAIFACTKCGWTMERMVSSAYRKKIVSSMDYCSKCDKTRRFYFLAAQGIVGKHPNKPIGIPEQSDAALWWKKTREGKTASAPLDAVCKPWEY